MKGLNIENNPCVISSIAFIPNFFVNLLYILNVLGYKTPIFDIRDAIELTLVIAIGSTTFIFSSSLKKFDESCISYGKKKSLPYKITTILLFIYSIITIFLFKDIYLNFSLNNVIFLSSYYLFQKI